MGPRVRIMLNGDPFELDASQTVAELLAHLSIDGRRVAVEHVCLGLKPDPALAMKFYLQAQASGIPDASQSINGLQSWMQK